ncbi:hypothetical protein ACHQM5_011478 [Ranunculus cassubicifolius]
MSLSDEESSIQLSNKERNFRATPPVYAPCFFISHGKKFQNQTFCIPSDGSHHVRSVPELRGMECRGSSYGWLILQSYFSDECYLFNPVTLSKIQLPSLPHDTFYIAVLTYPPSDPKCVIMFFSEEEDLCIFCKVGDEKWIEQEVRAQNSDKLVDDYVSAVSREGKIYLFFEDEDQVAIIDVRDNFACIELYEIKMPLWSVPTSISFHSYFLESCGEFFRVIKLCLAFSNIVQKFLVFRLDLSKMTGEKVESLGNRIFLIGGISDSASLTPSEFGAKGNCIYFFAAGRTELSVFDMDNGTITMTQLCPTKFRQRGRPFWVVPSCNAQVKKEVAEVMEEFQVTSSNLLPELLEMIFRFLHLGGILRFRFASKAFISMSLPIRSFHPQALSNSQHLPWLISSPYGKSDICHFYHPIYTDVYTMKLPQLRGAIVGHAKFGWLLMSVGRTYVFFFNPFSTEIIKLPEQSKCLRYINISFSSPPTSSDYVVFGVEDAALNYVIFSVYRKVQDLWSRHFLRDRPYSFVASQCNPVFHNGVFYCLSKDGKLGIFNPNATNEDDMWRVYMNLSVQDVRVTEDSSRSFIMECDGEIYSVFVGFLGTPVRVYKFDQSKKKMKWLKVGTLGHRLMFLSHTTSLLLPAVLKGTENRIYFPRFKGSFCVFYSLSSGKYHSFRDQEPRPDWINTSEDWNCTWFQNTK